MSSISIPSLVSEIRKWIVTALLWLTSCLITGCGEGVSEGGVVPNPHFDQVPSEITEYLLEPAVFVFSKTSGWRHTEGIAGADLFFVELATEAGFGVYTSANGAMFNAADLARFDVIIFNNVTGNALSLDQQHAFEAWMNDGGAWIGLHGAGDHSLQPWDWYQEALIGTRFIGHTTDPPIQTANLVTLEPRHPIMTSIPDDWSHTDEWYSFSGVPLQDGVTRLVGIDEDSYAPVNVIVKGWPEDLRMGDNPADHAMIWAVCRDEYRGVYSALGHSHESYRDPVYRQLLKNAFEWVTEDDESSC